MLAEGQAPQAGDETERGVVREVVYIGSVTRYMVDLDAGGTLTVVRQNVESSGDSQAERGRHVSLAWRPEHMYVIEQGQRGKRRERNEEGSTETRRARRDLWGGRRARVRGRRVRRRRLELVGDWQVAGLGSTLAEIQSKARDEGQVNLVEWAGYADKSWADQFTKQTGCKVGRKDGATSDEMIDDISTGQYDGVSASGNASVRLMKRGDVAPVNTDLIPNYADVAEGLKNQDYNSQDGHPYGVPHGRGWNVLAWRTDVVKPAPDSWSVDLEREQPVQGEDLDLRRLDLHRGRRRVPQGDATRPEDRQPVPAQRGAVQRRGRPAEDAEAERRRVVGATTRSRSSRTRTRTSSSGRPGHTR